MSYPQILHHGAIAGVTGSCHQLQMDAEHGLLIDCGLFQDAGVSSEGRAGANNLAIDFHLAGINALVATHVHIDHVGRIPYLLAAGFKGSIMCSDPSAKLLPIVLEDAFKLGFSRDQQQVERYLKLLEQRIIALLYNSWFTLVDSQQLKAAIRLQCAGHILGSAYVEIGLHYKHAGASKRIVFSGDLGAQHSPLLPALTAPECAGILVIESTYGDRLHEDRRNRRQRLEQVIEQALADNGTVLSQELLYELEDILQRKAPRPSMGEGLGRGQAASAAPIDWHNLPTILDSPLSNRFTQVYRDLEPFGDIKALARARKGRKPLSFANTDYRQSSGALGHGQAPCRNRAAGHCHCRGGHVCWRAHRRLPDSGRSGGAIQAYGPGGGYGELDGVRYEIGAKVSIIGGYSAHADQQGLVSFVTQMREWPSEIRIVRGDTAANIALSECYKAHYRQVNRHVEMKIPGALGSRSRRVAQRSEAVY